MSIADNTYPYMSLLDPNRAIIWHKKFFAQRIAEAQVPLSLLNSFLVRVYLNPNQNQLELAIFFWLGFRDQRNQLRNLT
jgi:hypothetical protein